MTTLGVGEALHRNTPARAEVHSSKTSEYPETAVSRALKLGLYGIVALALIQGGVQIKNHAEGKESMFDIFSSSTEAGER